MVSYIAQTRQSMATAGNNILFGGGRDVECTPTQHLSPITRPRASRSRCALHVPAPFPFPCSDVLSEHALACDDRLDMVSLIYFI